jgi:putative colanic acid biosynthesis glycosyltransferase
VPRFSIIIPCFNAGATLGKTLKSVAEQRFSDWELIVVDGGSTDGSAEIVDSYKSRISHYICEKDRGVYDAINKGLEHATGEWIYVLGADDQLADDKVLEKIAALPIKGETLIIGDVEYLNRTSEKVKPIHHSSFGAQLRWRNTVHHQGCFYHRSVFDEFRYDIACRVLGDYDLNIRLWKQGATALSANLLVARCEAQGLSKAFNRRLYSEELRIKQRYFSPAAVLVQYLWLTIKYLWKNS